MRASSGGSESGSRADWTMTIEANKQTARAFYDLMFNQCQPTEAIERYAGADYVQHNPSVPDGKDGLIAYFERMAAEYPGVWHWVPIAVFCTLTVGDVEYVADCSWRSSPTRRSRLMC
jgi:predicted SnoaL-like aldol condensation-catalyzing enzyme